MGSNLKSPWLIEGVEQRLRELIQTRSAEQVAAMLNMEFGLTLTRNAVIGRCGRQKIVMGSGNANQHGPSKKNPGRLVNHGHYFKIVKPVVLPPPPPKEPTEPYPYRCSIMELGNNTCRWPVGDPMQPGFFYCGFPEADWTNRLPYCRDHTKASWREH